MQPSTPEFKAKKQETLLALQNVWQNLVGGEPQQLSPYDSAEEIKSRFYESLKPEIDRAIQALGLIVDENQLADLKQEQNPIKRTDLELKFISEIIIQLKQLPPMKCGSFPKTIAETRKINCVGQTMIAGRLMEKANIKFYYANPAFHVMSILETSDGRTFCEDAGNVTDDPNDLADNVFEIKGASLTQISETQVLKANQPELKSRLIPIYPPNEIVTGIVENMETLHPNSGIKRDKSIAILYKENQAAIDTINEHNASGFLTPTKEAYYSSAAYQTERERMLKLLYPEGL